MNPYSPEVDDKYWAQRHRIFTKFDDGIQMDKEGWYSVTYEMIARHHAVKMINIQTTQRQEEEEINNYYYYHHHLLFGFFYFKQHDSRQFFKVFINI